MANKQVTHVVALTNVTTTNILNPPTGAGGVGPTATNQVIILKHLRVVNKTAGAVTVSLWKGGTGGNVAGTEFVWSGTSVAANSSLDWYGNVRFETTDFLVGGASAATSLTLNAEYELAVA